MNSAIERRRHPRYRLGDGVMAVSANNPGHIQDISMSGISFFYLHSADPIQDGETIDILDGQNGFFIQAIPCRTVSKKIFVKESSLNWIRMVRCSLEFRALSRSQKADLEAYIRTYSGVARFS